MIDATCEAGDAWKTNTTSGTKTLSTAFARSVAVLGMDERQRAYNVPRKSAAAAGALHVFFTTNL
jgi:hypothetical protein